MTALLLLTACLADIRPAAVEVSAAPDREEEGRALLAAAAEAHGGLDTWRATETIELVFRDDWHGMARMFNPWPEASVRAHIVQKPTTFDSRATFLGGTADGLTWGIEDWQTYTVSAEGERIDVDDADIRFMLPTTQYFVDLPFRLTEAELVRAVGEQTLQGETYDVVYATWGSIEKNADYDQYVVYIDPQTHLVEHVTYTVREMAPFVTGTCHLSEHQQVGGLWLPGRMTVTADPEADPGDGGMHTMVVEAARTDSVDPETWALRDGLEPLVEP